MWNGFYLYVFINDMKLWYIFGYEFIESECYILGSNGFVIMKMGVRIDINFNLVKVGSKMCWFGN